ncbi:MAG: SRPBCC family protein [Dehalococcoidia bacterium]
MGDFLALEAFVTLYLWLAWGGYLALKRRWPWPAGIPPIALTGFLGLATRQVLATGLLLIGFVALTLISWLNARRRGAAIDAGAPPSTKTLMKLQQAFDRVQDRRRGSGSATIGTWLPIRLTVEREIIATPDEVFYWFSNPARWAEISVGAGAIVETSEGEWGVESTYQSQSEMMGARCFCLGIVTEYDPPFGYASLSVGDQGQVGEGGVHIRPNGEDRTLVTIWSRAGLPSRISTAINLLLWPLLRPAIHRHLQEHFEVLERRIAAARAR